MRSDPAHLPGSAESRPEVAAYTDGACSGNPGPGGYGVVLISGSRRRELSGGFRRTTNNRMELIAVIRALQALTKPCRVVLHTDSAYVAQALNEGWAVRWRDKGWWISANKRAKNSDLWQALMNLMETHLVTLQWVKGHDGLPDNERADQLAVQAAAGSDLPPDAVFERLLLEPEPSGIPEGHPCFKCRTPVVKRLSDGRRKPGQTHYYEWHLYCPACKTTYTIEDAKRVLDATPQMEF